MDCRKKGRLRVLPEPGSRRGAAGLQQFQDVSEQTGLLELDGKKRPSLLAVCRVEEEAQGGEAHLVAGRFHKTEKFRRRDQRDDLPKLPPDGV